MKNLWFHLMPYKDLPENFREAYPSVWVDIDSRLLDGARVHEHYHEFLDELEYAGEVGFDGVCCNEHHQNGYGLMPSPNLIAATLSRRTHAPMICVMGNSLALYNPPTRVAEEFAMLDCMSGGRLIAGFPVGTPMDTVFAYGQNPSKLRERYLEAHDIVLKAWTTPETFSFNGRFNQLRYVNVWPRPVQKPHPPIWIPGGGSVETWQWCAEMDYVYCYLSYFGYKAGEATMNGFWDEMRRLGKDRNPYRAGFLQFVGVAETREEAYGCTANLRSTSTDVVFTSTRVSHRRPATRARRRSARGCSRRSLRRLRRRALRRRAGGAVRTWDEIVDAGYVIIGGPDEVAEKLREVCVNLNVGHLMLLLQFGDMSHELARYNTKLYAENVMPQIRDLFDDQWDDRWWPTPLENRSVPRAVA